MTDSLLAPGWEVLYKRYHHFCPSQEQEGPLAQGACSTFRMKRVHNKGFYSEQCELEASIALCFEWTG